MRLWLLCAALLAGVVFSGTAHAACTNPDGEEAVIVYNTTTKSLQFCNGAQWVGLSGGIATVAPGSTMVSGWPDVISCKDTSNNNVSFYIDGLGGNGKYYYRRAISGVSDNNYGLIYNADGTLAGHENSGSMDCVTGAMTINALYLAGKAFNLAGGGGAGSGGTSATMFDGWPDALRCGPNKAIYYLIHSPHSNGLVYYRFQWLDQSWDIAFNADGTFSSRFVHRSAVGTDALQDDSGTITVEDCGRSIAAFYSDGDAFNFVGAGATVDTLSSLSCTNGQFAKWDGTAWTCGSVSGGGGGGGDAIPAGAVMAFDLTACPSGWTEYTPARGRFIRGIDNGAGNDPDGTRSLGSVQNDAIKTHWLREHVFNGLSNTSGGYRASGIHPSAGGYGFGGAATNYYYDTTVQYIGAAETRPKNVSLLYCRKS